MTDLTRLRVGQGYDVHRLVTGRKLILGGVEIPFDKGLEGHSDADALLHALTDAILGACALGDIGQWFSDADPAFKNADSAVLLAKVMNHVKQHGFRLINADCTVICQKPKLEPHMKSMHERVSKILEVQVDQINIKAKTNEKLGYLGRQEAIEAQAVVLMFRQEDLSV